MKIHDLLDEIYIREENIDKDDIILYKEDKKKYLLESVSLTDPLDDESADSGVVVVLETKGADFYEYFLFLSRFMNILVQAM